MINIEMAKDYYMRAKRCLKEAELAYNDEDAAMTIRRAQEALELSVKSLLRLLGIEYPREHDVSDAFLENRNKLPEDIKSKAEELANLISELASIRGPALYGYEREGIPASKAFSLDYAKEILDKVKAYATLIGNIIDKYT